MNPTNFRTLKSFCLISNKLYWPISLVKINLAVLCSGISFPQQVTNKKSYWSNARKTLNMCVCVCCVCMFVWVIIINLYF